MRLGRQLACLAVLLLGIAGWAQPGIVPQGTPQLQMNNEGLRGLVPGEIPWLWPALQSERALAQGRRPEQQLLDTLLAAVKSEKPRESSDAAYFLGIFKEPRAVPGLIALLERPAPEKLDVMKQDRPELTGDLTDLAIHPRFAYASFGHDPVPGPFDLHTVHREAIIALGALAANPLALATIQGTVRSDDPYIRLVGTAVLGAMKNPVAITPLLAIVADPKNRFAGSAIHMLGAMGVPEATRALIDLAEKNAAGTATDALVEELGKIGLPAAHALASLSLGNLRMHDACRAVEVLKALDDPQTIPRLSGALKSPDTPLRVRAALALVWLRDPRTFPHLEQATHDTDEHVRTAAVDGLAALGGPRAYEALLPLAKQDTFNVQTRAIRALVDVGDPRAERALSMLLREHGDRSIVACAAQALGKLRATAVVPDLLEMLKIRHASLHEACVEALGNIQDPRAVDPLLRVMRDDPDVRVRRMAACGLVYTRRPEVIAYFLADLQRANRSQWETEQDIDLLVTLKASAAVKPMLAIAAEEKDAGIRRRAALGLAKLDPPRAIQPLIALLASRNAYGQSVIQEALAGIGAPAVEPLLAAYQEDRWPECMWFMQTLARVKDSRCVPAYLKGLGHKEYNVRSAARDGLQRYSGLNYGFEEAKWRAWWEKQ